MALNAYLTLVAERIGPVRGSVTQRTREGTIMVHAVRHEVVGPRDPASGRPTGKRMHKPLILTKDLDKSTPLLYEVLAHNINIPKFELRFFRPDPMGLEKHAFTIELTNANISSINYRMSTRAREIEREEVAFTYQRIAWTWMDGNVTADDDWETPR